MILSRKNQHQEEVHGRVERKCSRAASEELKWRCNELKMAVRENLNNSKLLRERRQHHVTTAVLIAPAARADCTPHSSLHSRPVHCHSPTLHSRQPQPEPSRCNRCPEDAAASPETPSRMHALSPSVPLSALVKTTYSKHNRA